MLTNIYSHERSYSKKYLASIIHRNRLKTIISVLNQLEFEKELNLTWGDFGCSDGYIIDKIKNNTKINFNRIVGFDHSSELIERAKNKSLNNTFFKIFNMNNIQKADEKFSLVSCFETLEHVGNQKKAMQNLYNHLKKDGILLIAIPNEIGFIGLFKFIGRYFIRLKPYGNFFNKKSRLSYFLHVLFDRPISKFREKNQDGHGPHLGFDYRETEKSIQELFLNEKRMLLLIKKFTLFNSNVIFILKKN